MDDEDEPVLWLRLAYGCDLFIHAHEDADATWLLTVNHHDFELTGEEARKIAEFITANIKEKRDE